MNSIFYLLFVFLAYVVGSFPTGVVLSVRRYGLDVREIGSGNIGATNVTRVFGWYAGVFVFIVDFLKGFLPVYFALKYFPENRNFVAAIGAATVVGHCFSLFLKGSGGKGVATSMGVVFVLSQFLGVVGALVYVTVLALTRISALGSLSGLLAVNICGFFLKIALPYEILMCVITGIVLYKHIPNLKRLWTDFQQRKKI